MPSRCRSASSTALYWGSAQLLQATAEVTNTDSLSTWQQWQVAAAISLGIGGSLLASLGSSGRDHHARKISPSPAQAHQRLMCQPAMRSSPGQPPNRWPLWRSWPFWPGSCEQAGDDAPGRPGQRCSGACPDAARTRPPGAVTVCALDPYPRTVQQRESVICGAAPGWAPACAGRQRVHRHGQRGRTKQQLPVLPGYGRSTARAVLRFPTVTCVHRG